MHQRAARIFHLPPKATARQRRSVKSRGTGQATDFAANRTSPASTNALARPNSLAGEPQPRGRWRNGVQGSSRRVGWRRTASGVYNGVPTDGGMTKIKRRQAAHLKQDDNASACQRLHRGKRRVPRGAWAARALRPLTAPAFGCRGAAASQAPVPPGLAQSPRRLSSPAPRGPWHGSRPRRG
jgi:hypothetical protein